jgi:hypothetical protein
MSIFLGESKQLFCGVRVGAVESLPHHHSEDAKQPPGLFAMVWAIVKAVGVIACVVSVIVSTLTHPAHASFLCSLGRTEAECAERKEAMGIVEDMQKLRHEGDDSACWAKAGQDALLLGKAHLRDYYDWCVKDKRERQADKAERAKPFKPIECKQVAQYVMKCE